MTRLLLPSSGKTEQLVAATAGASPFCLRQTDRQHSWRHTSEGGFNSARYEVAWAPESEARPFVERHHYSGAWAGGSLSQYALYASSELVGVAVLSNGGFKPVLTGCFPGLEPYAQSSELGRLVLLDEVPANAESWFLARVFELAAQGGMRGIVSHSDPIARFAPDGRVVMPGHVGTIYQASNATYAGRATSRTIWSFADGTVFNEQNIGKIRKQTKGHEYAEELLVANGARPRRKRQAARDWLPTALRQACTSSRHPGNHRYLFALGDRRARRTVSLGHAALPYPKKDLS